MTSRSGGYESLPAESQDGASNNSSAEEQARAGRNGRPTASTVAAEGSPLVGAEAGEGRTRSGGSMDDATAAVAPPVKGESNSRSETAKAGEQLPDKKDPTGGLPTAEGVFVGDPVSQSTAAFHTGGGGGGYGRTPTRATVITSAPPAYSNNVAAAVAAANAAGGDGRGIAIPYQGGGGGPGQHTVIVMNAPAGHQFGQWGRLPQPFVCRACGHSGMTVAVTVRAQEILIVKVGQRNRCRESESEATIIPPLPGCLPVYNLSMYKCRPSENSRIRVITQTRP